MFPLVRYFSAVSAIAVAFAMIAVAVVVTRITTQQLIEERQSSNVALTQIFSNSIWSQFSGYVHASAGLSGDALRAHPQTQLLSKSVVRLMRGLSVMKVKIYAKNGNTVFSTQASQMGDNKYTSSGFFSAIIGHVTSEISHRNKFDAIERQIFNVDVVSSYVPIRNQTGEIEGVFQIYDNVTTTLEKVSWRRNVIIAYLGLLFALLYLCLLLIVRRAANLMQEQRLQIEYQRSALAEPDKFLRPFDWQGW